MKIKHMALLEAFRLRMLESIVETSDRIARARNRNTRIEAPHLVTGRRGERAAFFYLRRHGFLIAARGWHSTRAPGDLDLIAWEADTLCFVEVKTRTTRAIAPAETAVNRHKQQTLMRLARNYLRQLNKPDVPVRFDILSIYFEAGKEADFELFRGAFGWD